MKNGWRKYYIDLVQTWILELQTQTLSLIPTMYSMDEGRCTFYSPGPEDCNDGHQNSLFLIKYLAKALPILDNNLISH